MNVRDVTVRVEAGGALVAKRLSAVDAETGNAAMRRAP